MIWVRLILAALLSWIAYVRTDGFIPSRIEGELLKGEDPPYTEEIAQILSQPFQYLGRGRQAFIFVSGEYVIKFFNQSYLRPVFWQKEKRARRRLFYETSYEIAYRHLGEGILFLHMHPTNAPLPLLQIEDKAHGIYSIDLKKVPFVLQRRGIPLVDGLNEIYRQGGKEAVQNEKEKFLQIQRQRKERGIADADGDIEHNWGYLDGKLFQMDPGRLYYDKNPKDIEESIPVFDRF